MDIIVTSNSKPSDAIEMLSRDFINFFTPLESYQEGRLFLLYDEKSNSYYMPCHLKAIDFCSKADFEATIDDADDGDIYKLNRNVTENESAFAAWLKMQNMVERLKI